MFKTGIYYSPSQDALMYFFYTDNNSPAVIYHQWCPAGTFGKKEGYYFNFGQTLDTDGKNGHHNFQVLWDSYKPEFISNEDYATFMETYVYHMFE